MTAISSAQIVNSSPSLTRFVNLVATLCLITLTSLYSTSSHSQNCSYLSYNGGSNLAPLFYRENGESKGMLSDLLKAAATRNGKFLTLGNVKPWKRLLVELKQGSLDFLAGVTYSNQWDKFVDYSVPLSVINLRVYANKKTIFDFNRLSDLKPLVGGKILGMSFGDEVDKYAFNHLVIEEKLSLMSLFKMLEYGRLDYVIMYENAGDNYLMKNDLQQKIVPLTKPLHVMDVYIAASRHSYCYSDIKNILAKIKPPEHEDKINTKSNYYIEAEDI